MRRIRVRRGGAWSERELSRGELARLSPVQRERLRVLSAQWPGEDDGCRGGWWRVPDSALEEICALLDAAGGAS